MKTEYDGRGYERLLAFVAHSRGKCDRCQVRLANEFIDDLTAGTNDPAVLRGHLFSALALLVGADEIMRGVAP